MERAQKRRKTTKACDNCRRQKTRCEWNATSDESPEGGCHRCRVLSQTCTIDERPNRVPAPSPSTAPTSGIPRGDATPSVAEPLEEGRNPSKYQLNHHECPSVLESAPDSESFFRDHGQLSWSTPMAMLTRLTAWHDGRPPASDTGKDPASAGILSGLEVQELLSV
jgi:hypothetical protein